MTWRNDAACRGMDTNIFYPPPHNAEAVALAKGICATCPVSDDCLLEVLVDVNNYDNFGIFGGTSAKQRQKLRRTLGIDRNPVTFELAPCGTEAAHRRHLRKEQRPCADCRQAHGRYLQELAEKRARLKAGA